jgi:hypothetical protein
LPSINHIICSRTFVKQDKPLREMDANIYGFSFLALALHFAFISPYEICAKDCTLGQSLCGLGNT